MELTFSLQPRQWVLLLLHGGWREDLQRGSAGEEGLPPSERGWQRRHLRDAGQVNQDSIPPLGGQCVEIMGFIDNK
jgi:hypothetical protein